MSRIYQSRCQLYAITISAAYSKPLLRRHHGNYYVGAVCISSRSLPHTQSRMQVLCLCFGRYYCSVAAASLHRVFLYTISLLHTYATYYNTSQALVFFFYFFFVRFCSPVRCWCDSAHLVWLRTLLFSGEGKRQAPLLESRIMWIASQHFAAELMHGYLHDNL